jgi:hypothetical protein
MKAATTEPLPQDDPKLYFAPQTLRNCFLAWLVPGLGHYMTGRKRAAAIIAGSLFAAYLLAILQGGLIYEFNWAVDRIRSLGYLCQSGMGLPFLIANAIDIDASPLGITYDYATSYFLIAGMINWLAVMDTFDISVNRK